VPVDLDPASLTAVAPEIWEMMLGLELEALSGSVTGRVDGQCTMTGLVTVVGGWTGAIAVETSCDAARAFAAAMLATEPSAVSTDEVHDALAELTNMCGGSIKNLMPGVNTLGIPTVTEGTGYTVRVPRTIPIQGLVYTCGGHVVIVTLFESL
jgi:CheY-specific phosphatase CheX